MIMPSPKAMLYTSGNIPVTTNDVGNLEVVGGGYQFSSYAPDPNGSYTGAPAMSTIDIAGNLMTRAQILTDELSFRDGFTTLVTELSGTATFTYGSDIVNGDGTTFSDGIIGVECYVKLSTDSETYWTRVLTVNSDTQITLDSPYLGTGGTGTIQECCWRTITPAGATNTIANSSCLISASTNAGAVGGIFREADYLPFVSIWYLSQNQRLANQTTKFGFLNDPINPSKQAAVYFDGTNGSTIKFVTSWGNGANDQQITTITLPTVPGTYPVQTYTTATELEYQIVLNSQEALLSINGITKARHKSKIPGPYDVLGIACVVSNSVAVPSNTSVSVSSVFINNYDNLNVTNNTAGGALNVQMHGTDPDGNSLDINVDGNGNLPVVLTTPDGEPVDVGVDEKLRVGTDQLILVDPLDTATINPLIWVSSSNLMSMSMANGVITLNSNSSLASGSWCMLSTVKQPMDLVDYPLYAMYRAQIVPQANSVFEFGFISASAGQPPTNGTFVRWTGTTPTLVTNNYGVESSIPIVISNFSSSYQYNIELEMRGNEIEAEISTADGLSSGNASLSIANNVAAPYGVSHVPIGVRIYNTGAVASAPQIKIGKFFVARRDLQTYKPWADVMVGMGKGSWVDPILYTQTAVWANSAAPADAALSNTVPSYTTLGGRFAFVTVAGAETDYCLFAYQVPVGYQLTIKEIVISDYFYGGTIGANGQLMEWALGVNSSGASLATAGTYPPIRIPLGTQIALPAPTGGNATQPLNINRNFATPVVCEGGRYVQIILRIPVGTVQSSVRVRGIVSIVGNWE